jgi:uncharacterized phage protein (TIGR02220 family)
MARRAVARIRTVKPDFFTSEDIVSLSPLARLLYIALWCEADREGRFTWRPATFKLRYFPGDRVNIESLCKELTHRELVIQYGGCFAYIPSFLSHQHPNLREKPSALPDPSTCMHVKESEPHVGREGKEGKGREGEVGRVPDVVEQERKRRAAEKRRQVRAQAEEVLAFLNTKASKGFELDGAAIKPIIARLEAGASVEDCRAVIAKKCRDWLGKPEMSMYLRPSTLFGPEKFAEYKGELGAPLQLVEAKGNS